MSQQAVEDFYRGKKLDMIIGYSPGGTYDLYARLVARYLGNYIPGKPIIVPRNMPGAGSRAAANWVYNVAPQGRHGAGHRRPVAVAAAGDRRQADQVRHHEVHLHRQSERREQHDGGLARLGHQDHRRRQEARGDRRRDRRLDVVAISQGDERADRHEIQDRARLSRRQRHQSRAGARRGRGAAARTAGPRGRRRGRTGSPRRRSTSWCRSASPRRPTCRTCRC